MKKAIGYTRKSTKDQSNFSIEGQQKYIHEYAVQHDIELLEMFTDDGRSAKNFDRPDWKLLEEFITKHSSRIDYLIVAKYDRFSRNVAQGLTKIELLERKYRIIIVSVFEQMFIDYDSPFFFKQRADMLVSAEFEWHVIRDRTKHGIHNALSAGRFINKAPFGYENGRDINNAKMPVLHINEIKAAVVKNIYAGFLRGISFIELSRIARSEGLTTTGRSAIQRILTNPVYGGLIFVPPYKKEASKYVAGKHEGIIPTHTWWQVQNQLNKPVFRTVVNEEVPLRSVLHCQCGQPFTAGNSKGKKQYYWYYKCNKHPKTNHSAKKLHSQFDEVLSYLSLSDMHITYLQQIAVKEMSEQLESSATDIKQFKKELSTAQANMISLEEKFITGDIQSETFKRWSSKYSATISHLEYSIQSRSGNVNSTWSLFRQELPKLGDISALYHYATITQKQSLINLVFNSQLRYEDGSYRTPFVLPIFAHNTLILKEKGLLILEQPFENGGGKHLSTPTGTLVELHHNLFILTAQINFAG